MALDIVTYCLSKKYVNETADGLGAVKGASATLKETKKTDEGIEVTFEWTGNSGSKQTESVLIPKGDKGERGDTGLPGKDGVSPTIEPNEGNGNDMYRLDITDYRGTFTTSNLVGDGTGGIVTETGFVSDRVITDDDEENPPLENGEDNIIPDDNESEDVIIDDDSEDATNDEDEMITD